jgi:site-specific recombinase XerD
MPPGTRRKRAEPVKKQDIPLESALRAYLLYHEDKNHSAKTIRWYSDMLERFLDFVGPDAKIGELDADTIRNYLREVRRRDYKQFTMHAYARTLKTFLLWLEREGYASELAKAIDMPKVPRYQDVTIDVLSDDEISHLLSILDPATDFGSRERTMVCLMLESGLRLGEVAGLRVDDIHLKDSYIRVRGKGGKENYVPLGPTTHKALTRYLTVFRVPASANEKALFLNVFGEPLKYESIKTIFDRLAVKSGITRLHPHLLRHTAATKMLANGADLHTVQRLLRHSDIRTTLRYLHLVPAQLQEKMQAFSPLTGIAEPRVRLMPRSTPERRRGAAVRPALRAVR